MRDKIILQIALAGYNPKLGLHNPVSNDLIRITAILNACITAVDVVVADQAIRWLIAFPLRGK